MSLGLLVIRVAIGLLFVGHGAARRQMPGGV
jgi:hypothetical protein